MDAERYAENDQNTPIFNGSDEGPFSVNKSVSISPQRMKYEAQVQVIRDRIGGLEVVRSRLGLSQRKICQLLLVDPSAWNRWLKDDSAPPHIWRMLEWYLGLQDKLPGLSPNFFLGEFTQSQQHKQIKELQLQIRQIQSQFEVTQAKQLQENLLLRNEVEKWQKKSRFFILLVAFLASVFCFKYAFAESGDPNTTKKIQTNENQTYYKDKNINNDFELSLKSENTEKSATQPTKSVTMPIGYYTPETSLALGILHLHNYNQATTGKTSNSLSHLSYTLKKQTLFNSTAKFYLTGGKYEWGTQLIYRYFPDEFYGTQFNSTNDHLESGEKFTEKVSILGLTGGYQFYQDMYVRTLFQYDHREILHNENESTPMLDSQVSLFTPQLNTSVMQFSFDYDDRDFIQSAKNGDLLKLSFTHYFSKKSNGESLHPYVKSELEYRKYLSIFTNQIIAGQILLSQIKSDQSTSIPFYYLNSIGGGSRLRGYFNGRYRDQALAMTQVDYRYEWNDRWVSTVFYSAARIGSDLSTIIDPEHSKWLSSTGIGVNYFIDPINRTKLRLDMGFVAEKRSIYFLIGDAI